MFIINGAGHLLRTDMIRPKDKKYYLLCLGKPRYVEAALAMLSHWHNTHVCHIAKIKVLKTGWKLNFDCTHFFFVFFVYLTDVFVCLCLSFAVYNPPDPVPIVAGVLTTAAGLAILLYICIYRTTAEEVQPNEFPQNSTEIPDNNASYSPQQLEAKEI